MNKIYARQGDVLLSKIDELPNGLTKSKTNIVVYGESSGHSHRLVGGDIFTKGTDMYLVLKRVGELIHEEHGTIKLGRGIYAVKRQREYLASDMTRVAFD